MLSHVTAPLAFPATSKIKTPQSCSCRQLQLLPFQHLPAWPSEYCTCEVGIATNVQKHVYAAMFVCQVERPVGGSGR